MGERKVLNKYILMTRRRSRKGNVLPTGKLSSNDASDEHLLSNLRKLHHKGKFNSRKEDAKGETYLGLKIFRFYFRCPRCSGEIAMKTDPERSDYIGTFFRGEISFWKNVSSRVKSVERSFACTRRAASRLFCSRGGALF